MTIYQRIKALRIEKGMSQSDLALKVGYQGRSAISKVENGERDISQSMITKYADALGVSPNYLITGWTDDSTIWIDAFKNSLSQLLLNANNIDINDSEISKDRLYDIAEGIISFSFSEACDIANTFGTSLDEMVGLNAPEARVELGRINEFAKLFCELTAEQQTLIVSQIKGILLNQ